MTNNETPQTDNATQPENKTVSEQPRVEVSASTVIRMMGIPTMTDFKLLEGKVEFVSTKVNHLAVKVEKILSTLNAAPTASDLDRIDIQVGSVKTLVKEILNLLGEATSKAESASSAEANEQSRKLRAGIRTSNEESK